MISRITLPALWMVLATSPVAAQRAAHTSSAPRQAAPTVNPFDPPLVARGALPLGSHPTLPTVAAPGEVTSTITGAAPVATLRDGANQLAVVAPGDRIGPWRVTGIEEGGVRLELTVPGLPRERFLPRRREGTATDTVVPGATSAGTASARTLVLPGEIPTLLLPPASTVQPVRPN